ncbi:GspH/FimT family pseudopilin [Steroidobacter flavus]|uniref:Type II secretion system protein H n=1 Tax=Steroidobacter flavus TaxID=1842136 RepID=A0ABV8T6C7_9GAMM
MHRTCPPGAAPGFTLLELMVTLSVAGVLLGLTAPTFRGMWLDSQRALAVNGSMHSIFLARSSAITYHRTVSICRSADGQTCSPDTTNWQLGWIVFVNEDRDEPPVRDRNERVLVTQAALPGGTITSNRRGYSFKPYLRSVVNGTVVFCDRRGSAHARAIIINIAGRPRVSKRDSNNRPLRCPSG